MAAALRKTGIDVLGDMPWGTHFCLFYETKEDLLDALVPYFKAGLQNNEFCVWAVSEPLTLQQAEHALRQAVPAFDRQLADGNIEILSGREWYLKENKFDLKRVTDGWNEKLRAALARGRDGMRVSGNAFWLDTEYWPDFKLYEQQIDASLAGQPMTVLCTYPLAASRASDVLDVALAHQGTIARRKGVWELIDTVAAHTAAHSLTPRELEVLSWVARGKSAWEIGEILRIAKRTVDEHTQTAVRKLGAVNRTQAVAIALRDRIIEV